MIIVYMKEQGTIKVTDDNGQSLHKRGDDKIMCPNIACAEVMVDGVSQITGKLFFRTHDDSDYIRWEGH